MKVGAPHALVPTHAGSAQAGPRRRYGKTLPSDRAPQRERPANRRGAASFAHWGRADLLRSLRDG
jgi:hypothetical protein